MYKIVALKCTSGEEFSTREKNLFVKKVILMLTDKTSYM